MLHPDTELRFINETIGYGVVATRLIPKGTITWAHDALDQSISQERLEQLPPDYRPLIDKYCFLDRRGALVLCWDLARFINHSCEANCRSPGYDFEVAVRDIQPGEELTDDYGSLNIDSPFRCCCNSPHCRGQIRPRDLLAFASEWDEIIRGPFRLIGSVAQPLRPFVRDWSDIESALAGRTPIASCTRNFAEWKRP